MKGGPKNEPWVKSPRGLLASKAWRSMGINERRLIDFLMLEHMRHGGQRNGKLVAPRKQLEVAGIGARHISGSNLRRKRAGPDRHEARQGSGTKRVRPDLATTP